MIRRLLSYAVRCFLPLLVIVVLVSPSPSAPATLPRSLLLGAAWNPEQWPEARWERDLELMEQARIHLLRG